MTRDGKLLWGMRMPACEPRRIRVGGSLGNGSSAEVFSALETLNLAMPITPQEVRTRYRQLVRELHPDRNPGNPEVEERMKAVNVAAELLTSLEPSELGDGHDDQCNWLVLPRVGTRSAMLAVRDEAGHARERTGSFRCFATWLGEEASVGDDRPDTAGKARVGPSPPGSCKRHLCSSRSNKLRVRHDVAGFICSDGGESITA